MLSNRIVLISIFFLCFINLSQSSRKFRRPSLVSNRKDFDGFSLFGRPDRRERKNRESKRRNNLYAAKKLNEFGSNAKKSLTSMIKTFFYIEEDEPRIVSGKKIKTFIQQQGFDWYSYSIILVSVVLGLSVIYYILTVQPFSEDELIKLKRRAQDRNDQIFKNYDKLKFIEQNGVHPDAASGKIYRFRF